MQNIVEHGYRIPFSETPPSFYAKNNISSLKNFEFATQAISNLLQNRCIIEVEEAPYCTNPLTVAENNDKLRLVLDLRHVNKYVKLTKFKYEDLRTVVNIFEGNEYFFTFDLKSGYHHVPINNEFYKFLGFAWEFEDVTRYFVFVVLPFGLNIACFVFTKLMRQLVKKWRSEGIKSIMYLDDGLAGNISKALALLQRNTIIHDLSSAGLTINFEKSHLELKRKHNWLGFEVNTNSMIFTVPKQKISELLFQIASVLVFQRTTARKVAKIAGHIISMSVAIGPLAHLLTKQMYKFIESRINWDNLKPLTSEVKTELLFWQSNLEKNNGLAMKSSQKSQKLSIQTQVLSHMGDMSWKSWVTSLPKEISLRLKFKQVLLTANCLLLRIFSSLLSTF